ncbi:RNA/RNP complex-1-interacting phosphatase-like [Ornithodoros turicata]|uniref:RNA/RNP complex-1-interacting phosphatase-like n=1 Tax=Ornithodoros turicata TaxID=34597 RepID=UPI0031386FBB
MGRSSGIPDRWSNYSCIGGIVPGTPFLAFKVPLQDRLCSSLPREAQFTPTDLLNRVHGLGLIIDLTCTTRYYNPSIMVDNGIYHHKIVCAGQRIPSPSVIRAFFDTVDWFLRNPSNYGLLIGVHCTHGVNRTGYLICKYMIERMGVPPSIAVHEFQESRGHAFDRQEYVRDLCRRPYPT